MFNFQNKGISLIGIVIVIVAIGLLSGGLYFYLQQQAPEIPSGLQEQEQKEEVIVGEREDAVCDNFDCLISAASQCQPISATIDYSGIPNPLFPFPDFSLSGQTKYEIKKSPDVNDCTLIISVLATVLSGSEEGRRNLLAQGMTDAEITAQLQAINESFELGIGYQKICSSSAAIITTFLTDAKKLVEVTSREEFERFEEEMGPHYNVRTRTEDLKTTVTTYTLSSGQELVCTVTMPLQPANTSITISIEECQNQGGYTGGVDNDGMACPKSHIDLGTIVGSGIKMNDKDPQCCVLRQ